MICCLPSSFSNNILFSPRVERTYLERTAAYIPARLIGLVPLLLLIEFPTRTAAAAAAAAVSHIYSRLLTVCTHTTHRIKNVMTPANETRR